MKELTGCVLPYAPSGMPPTRAKSRSSRMDVSVVLGGWVVPTAL